MVCISRRSCNPFINICFKLVYPVRLDMLMEEELFVRDIYSHRKGFPSPHLKLEHMSDDRSFNKRQQQVRDPIKMLSYFIQDVLLLFVLVASLFLG